MGDLENAAAGLRVAAEKLNPGPLVTIENDITHAHLGGIQLVLSNLRDALGGVQQVGGQYAESLSQEISVVENVVTQLLDSAAQMRVRVMEAMGMMGELQGRIEEAAARVVGGGL